MAGLFVLSCMGHPVAPVETPPSEFGAQHEAPDPKDLKRPDPHSYARPEDVRVEHVGLRVDVRFTEKRLLATATLRLRRTQSNAPLVLDTRELEILKVRGAGLRQDATPLEALAEWEPEQPWTGLEWELGAVDPTLGRPLTISLPPGLDVIRIDYRTSAAATGLQWLAPEQTADGTDPFLYSQSQAIHARSWMPCQDTPGVRQTFDAVIHHEPRLRALMAAEGPIDAGPGLSRFLMPQPVPSYLLALAVGRLERRDLGPHTAVWAEPSRIEDAAFEFADVESMLEAGAALYGPYPWGRYDLLVLPPAFPFGGMENPRLTFATPTILAGDRSLVSLVAHELAHSWSGNLVTNATWSDLWLNEGFTVYFERRIVEAIYGAPRAAMERALGRQELLDALDELPGVDQHLKLDLEGRDPDDAMTVVPYEKGALFLEMLEAVYGRAALDAFLTSWFASHAFSSVSTAEFLAFLETHLIDKVRPRSTYEVPDVDAWVFGPGIGPQAPETRSDAFDRVDVAVVRFVAGDPAAELGDTDWVPQQRLHFLRHLPRTLPVGRLAELDAAWGLTASQNSEILAQWLEIAILHEYRAVDARLETFLKDVGRRKFLMPLYRGLLAAGREDEARRLYARARPGYHAIARRSLDDLLGSN